MFRFMQRFGRDSRARWRGTGAMTRVRRRHQRLDCEALEGRQLLSGYYVINAFSGKLLDDPASSTNNGAPIQQWQPNGGYNQGWDFVGLSNGNYEIYNESSGRVLGDPGFSKWCIRQVTWHSGRRRSPADGVAGAGDGDPRRTGVGACSSRPSLPPPPGRLPPRSRTAAPSAPGSGGPSTTARSGSGTPRTSAGRRTPTAGAPARTAIRRSPDAPTGYPGPHRHARPPRESRRRPAPGSRRSWRRRGWGTGGSSPRQ